MYQKALWSLDMSYRHKYIYHTYILIPFICPPIYTYRDIRLFLTIWFHSEERWTKFTLLFTWNVSMFVPVVKMKCELMHNSYTRYIYYNFMTFFCKHLDRKMSKNTFMLKRKTLTVWYSQLYGYIDCTMEITKIDFDLCIQRNSNFKLKVIITLRTSMLDLFQQYTVK